MNAPSRTKVVFEVIFAFFLILMLLKAMQIPPFGEWKKQLFQRAYLEYVVMISLPLILLFLTRRNFADYGISFKNSGYHFKVVAICFLPIVTISAGLSFLNWKQWEGSLILSLIEGGVLFALFWLLRTQPSLHDLKAALLIPGVLLTTITIGSIGSAFVFFFLFNSLGEEIFFRGYIQSRLNEGFGRPFVVFGIKWGWGLIITALMFSIMHVLNPFNPFLGKFDLAWPWGLWTFFLGLILGIVREKTDSIMAPTILHGIINFL